MDMKEINFYDWHVIKQVQMAQRETGRERRLDFACCEM